MQYIFQEIFIQQEAFWPIMPVLNQHHVNHFIDLSHGDVGGGHHQGEETRDRFVLEFDALGIEGYTDIGRTEYVARYPDPPPPLILAPVYLQLGV